MNETWAFGLSVRLRASADGGRRSAIEMTGESRLGYRPNWGLPSMTPPEQTGAPVYAFDRVKVEPGTAEVKAVILVPYPQMMPIWAAEVGPGADLPMYEGSRAVGVGKVLWRRSAHYPPTDAEASHYDSWLAGGRGRTDDAAHGIVAQR